MSNPKNAAAEGSGSLPVADALLSPRLKRRRLKCRRGQFCGFTLIGSDRLEGCCEQSVAESDASPSPGEPPLPFVGPLAASKHCASNEIELQVVSDVEHFREGHALRGAQPKPATVHPFVRVATGQEVV